MASVLVFMKTRPLINGRSDGSTAVANVAAANIIPVDTPRLYWSDAEMVFLSLMVQIVLASILVTLEPPAPRQLLTSLLE